MSRGRLSASLAACALALAPALGGMLPAQAAGKDVIQFWTRTIYPGYPSLVQAEIQAFEKRFPNIEIQPQIIPWTGGEKITVAVQSGNPPDVLYGGPDPQGIAAGEEVPVQSYLPASVFKRYVPSMLNAMKYNGKIYGLPDFSSPYVFAANASYLRKAGINYVSIQKHGWTFPEFLTDLQKLKSVVPWPFVFTGTSDEMLEEFLMESGMPYPLTSKGVFAYQGPRAQQVFSLFHTLLAKRLVPPFESAIDAVQTYQLFFSGQAAIVGREGFYTYTDMETVDHTLQSGKPSPWSTRYFPPKDLVFLPYPHMPGEPEIAPGGVGGFLLYRQRNASVQHLRDAARFIQFITDPTWGGRLALGLRLLPATYEGQHRYGPRLYMGKDNLQFYYRWSKLLVPPEFLPANVAAARGDVETDAIVPNWQALLAGTKGPDQAYHDMVQAALATLKRDLH